MTALQVTWFLLIGILIIGYAILDGFDLGVGFWHLFAKKKSERSAFIHSIEPFWDGNEVWLLTGGGALFAAFPPVYASVFSGFYLAMMLVLLGLIFRAVAIEYRDKVDSPAWTRAWDIAFAVGSVLPSILYGVAIGNVVRGLELNALGDYTAGFFALLNPFSLLCGLVGLSMFALHGAFYLSMKLDGEIAAEARGWATKTWYVFLVLFMVAVTMGLRGGYIRAWDGVDFKRFIPMATILLALVSNSIAFMFNKKEKGKGAFIASSCTIAFVMLSVATAVFPYMVFCTNDEAWSLTVSNSSSSPLTLFSMLIIALIGMPIVLGYTWFIHHIFRAKVKVHKD
ncbi:MAG: cytochrome d ubiquinol oxidase subunit II [Pontiellaceae bacterium]|nr:cytochrome d ubiquinol oxidase subunit II [Pontiellaceae bacterium]MBN2783975.1 cytochrome d ubiquinol oxidase subunit II [Pontiellaceae bacterium]